jgi:hypothetical protein
MVLHLSAFCNGYAAALCLLAKPYSVLSVSGRQESAPQQALDINYGSLDRGQLLWYLWQFFN